MTTAAKSVYYFGFYLIIMGITLTVAPNFLLATFQMPETQEVWIRILGIVVFNIGLLYVFVAPTNNKSFLVMAVYTRAAVLIWFVSFVAIGWAPLQLILFGLVDVAGAAWTYLSLKKDG